MSSQWYYLDQGKVCGPMSSSQLWLSAMEGFVDRNTPVRKGAAGKWVPASKVRGLLSRQGLKSLNSQAESPPVNLDQPATMAAIPVALDPAPEPVVPAPSTDAVTPRATNVAQPSTEPPLASRSDKTTSLLPDAPSRPLFWAIVGIASLLALAATGAFFLRGGDPVLISSTFEEDQPEQSQPEQSQSHDNDTAEKKREQNSSDSEFQEPGIVSADDSTLKFKRERDQPTSPLASGAQADEPPAAMHTTPDQEPMILEQDNETSETQPQPQLVPTADLARRSEPAAPPDQMSVITPERTKFHDLDEAERHICILEKLYQESRDLFAQIAQKREKAKDREREVTQTNTEIALLQGRLFDANRVLMAYQTEKNRIRRRTPGALTPVLDNSIRIAMVNVNEINNELAKLGGKIQSHMVDDKGNLEQVNALLAEVGSVVDDWFLASAPFGELLDDSYRQIEVQTTRWIGESPRFPLTYMSRAFAHTHLGEFEEALQDYRSVIKEFPDLEPQMTAAYGFTLCVQGDLRGAGEYFRKAENSQAEASWVHVFWGRGLHAAGKPHLAQGHFDQALSHNPKLFFAHESVAMLGAERSAPSLDGKDAVKHAEIACDLSDWSQWRPINLLAMNYAAVNQFDKAVEMVKRALARAPRSRRAELQRRLQEYQAEAQKLPK